MKWDKFDEYRPGLQLDRINSDGNYEPENCRWVTCQENAQNKRPSCRRIDAERVREVRSLYKSGELTQLEIASRFRIGRMTVSNIVRGKTWGNIQ